MNVLTTPLLSCLGPDGRTLVRRTLPGVFAALVCDEIDDFPALRPHQRHPWHAFLVQVGALAMVKAGLDTPPCDESAWKELLLALTPDDPDGAAWSLVSPPDRSALLQAPVPGGDLSAFKAVDTPDLLDMLVTAKNHDLKGARLAAPEPEHWLFSLVSLQTQEGYGGGGTLLGISRMNSGYGNRPGFGIEPPGGVGAHFRRDLARLLQLRPNILRDYPDFPSAGGVGLVWLPPWDGETSLTLRDLDPYYVEICRRIRLMQDSNGVITARAAGSKTTRIDGGALKGATGDPWTPLVSNGHGVAALTIKGGLSYRRLVPLLFPKSDDKSPARIAPLQEIISSDAEEGLHILARVLVRGQGKTQGFHERRIPVSKTMRRIMRMKATDRIAQCARDRVEDVALFSKRVLYPAVIAAFADAPGMVRFLDRFDRSVDTRFFDDLNAEIEVLDNHEKAGEARGRWLLDLRDIGAEALEAAIHSAPDAAMRHWRVRVTAHDRFDYGFKRHFRERITDEVWKDHHANR